MKSSDEKDWASYWDGAQNADEALKGGAKGDVLDAFWQSQFANLFKRKTSPLIVDMACGAGVVTRTGVAVCQNDQSLKPKFLCTDYSPFATASAVSAAATASQSFGVAADLTASPFAVNTADAVFSQFGIEYAGPKGFETALNMLKSDGTFAAIVHMKGGAIEDECTVNLDIISTISTSKTIDLARDVFEAGFSYAAGSISEEQFFRADKAFAPAIEQLKKTLSRPERTSAMQFLQKFYQDLGTMYQRMQSYQPDDVFDWLTGMEREVLAYQGRMRSMMGSAQTKEQLADIVGMFDAKGFVCRPIEPVSMGSNSAPAAWKFEALGAQ